MTLKNNRAPFSCYSKLCASFRSHWLIQTGFTVPKPPIWVKIDNFYSRVTLQFDVWPSKTIGHLFYATSSFMHHFVAIGDFKLELQSGNAHAWGKIDDFFSRVTLQFDVWPWKTTGHLFYSTHSISQPPVHPCFARAIELIAHPKITKILSFSWGFSSKVAFCTP